MSAGALSQELLFNSVLEIHLYNYSDQQSSASNHPPLNVNGSIIQIYPMSYLLHSYRNY